MGDIFQALREGAGREPSLRFSPLPEELRAQGLVGVGLRFSGPGAPEALVEEVVAHSHSFAEVEGYDGEGRPFKLFLEGERPVAAPEVRGMLQELALTFPVYLRGLRGTGALLG